MRTSRGRLSLPAFCCVAAAALCLGTASAQAAATAYPAGGSTFTGGPEGWKANEASCNVATLCTASGEYDGSGGNPPGSLAAKTNIALNLLTTFKATAVFQSPDFKVGSAGKSTLQLDREFSIGNLGELSPELKYSVKLIDKTAGTETAPVTETLKGPTAWGTVNASSSVNAGHTYALRIIAETSSAAAGSGLVSGGTVARFDNVSLSVQGSGNGGPGSNAELAKLIQNSLIGPAVLKGNRIFVKVKCPAKVGVACKTSVQGLLKKHKPATTTRTAKIGKSKIKRFVLKVKPKARGKLVSRKRLLFKETVKAGGAKATVYKRLKLIRR